MEIKEADWFSVETKYRLTLEHEGETYYWHGFQGEYGTHEEWFGADERRIEEPDWAEELNTADTFFDLCYDKVEEGKVKS